MLINKKLQSKIGVQISQDCNKAHEEYLAECAVLNYCLDHDVDPTYARIMLSDQKAVLDHGCQSQGDVKRSTHVNGFPQLRDNKLVTSTRKSAKLAQWLGALYNK